MTLNFALSKVSEKPCKRYYSGLHPSKRLNYDQKCVDILKIKLHGQNEIPTISYL